MREIKTREDIISEFMIEFDNSRYKDEILKCISREDIEKLLNENIREIEYTDKKDGFVAEYSCVDKKIIFNKFKSNILDNKSEETIKKLYKICVIHEMWHAISERQERGRGLYKIEQYGSEQIETGEAITEGITQLITERMFGYGIIDVYQFEKETVAVLEQLVGRESIISDYVYGTSKIEEKIEEKYGRVGLFNYKLLRKGMDERLVTYQKMYGIYRNSEEERKDKEQLMKEIKEQEKFVKMIMKNLLRREKKRVEEANSIDEFERYDALLETLNFCIEFKDIDEFDLEKEMEISSKRLGKTKEDNLKELEENMQKEIEEVTSEVTSSEINTQIGNIREVYRDARGKEGESKE